MPYINQTKTEVNKLSETFYRYFDLKVIARNCGTLACFHFKFLHVFVSNIIIFW